MLANAKVNWPSLVLLLITFTTLAHTSPVQFDVWTLAILYTITCHVIVLSTHVRHMRSVRRSIPHEELVKQKSDRNYRNWTLTSLQSKPGKVKISTINVVHLPKFLADCKGFKKEENRRQYKVNKWVNKDSASSLGTYAHYAHVRSRLCMVHHFCDYANKRQITY